MSLVYQIRQFLDAIGLDYLPENHCLPAYGFTGEKSEPNRTKKNTPKTEKNVRKITPGFRVDLKEEQGNIKSAWVSEKHSQDTELTTAEIRALNAIGANLQVAKVVKTEKIVNKLSNKAIAVKHHTPGRRDGYSQSTIDKIAAIVFPQPIGGGANQ